MAARGRALHQHHARIARIDAAEFAAQRVARDLGERAGELDAGRAAADDDEGEPGGALAPDRFALGVLEGGEDARADLERVVERLQAGRVRRPFVVAEVVVRGARGDDQVVVGQLAAVSSTTRALRGVDAVTSAMSMVAFFWPPRMWRIGAAMPARRVRRWRPGRGAA